MGILFLKTDRTPKNVKKLAFSELPPIPRRAGIIFNS
jgi:hypothetical protein